MLPFIPDVRQMYESLFPGGNIIGEAIGLLRDSYQFLSHRIDPSDGGRAIVLAFLSVVMTGGLMIQRRLGNTRSCVLVAILTFSLHGTMITLFGLSWFTYPILEYFLQRGNTGILVPLMSAISVVVGWGQHCLPEGTLLRRCLGLDLGYEMFPESGTNWGVLLFGLLALGISLLIIG
jgi:hypothetical protein